MKNQIKLLLFALLLFAFLSTQAQPGMRGGMGGMGAAPSGPDFGGGMEKLFGENTGFSANLEMHTPGGANGAELTLPGKIAFLEGKSRFEMDMTEMKGISITPQNMAMMKQMGMGNIIMISRTDRKVTLAVYPGMSGYVENPMSASATAASPSDYKMEATELGKETLDGHPCVKKKVVITGKEGSNHESTVWSASDLKDFPIKIESQEGGKTTTLLFKEVKLEKPDAGQFEAPAGYTKYTDMQTMMMQGMMKNMGNRRGMPGGQ